MSTANDCNTLADRNYIDNTSVVHHTATAIASNDYLKRGKFQHRVPATADACLGRCDRRESGGEEARADRLSMAPGWFV